MAIPHLLSTEHLTGEQLPPILRLLEECRRQEPVTLSFPTDDADRYYLLYDSGQALAAILAVSLLDGETAEISAFTAPAFRRQGYFSLLLEQASEDFPDTEFLLAIDGRCPAALEAIRAFDMESAGNEYMMEIRLDGYTRPAPPSTHENLSLSPSPDDSTHFTIMLGASPIGEFHLAPLGGSAYFYGFIIRPDFRRQGLGRNAFFEALSLASEQGYSSLKLQVSDSNTPAVSLYKKSGLRICETLSYYVY